MENNTHPSQDRYKPYPEYKSSSVEWVDRVPSHWQKTKIKFEYSIQLGKMLQSERKDESDILVPYLKAVHVLWYKVDVTDLPEKLSRS